LKKTLCLIAPDHCLCHLVGGFNHLEKYEFVNEKDDIPYMKWEIKVMFETTNQIFITFYNPIIPIGYSHIDLYHIDNNNFISGVYHISVYK